MSEEQIKHLRIELFNCTENILDTVKPHVCQSKYNEIFSVIVSTYADIVTALDNCKDMNCGVSE